MIVGTLTIGQSPRTDIIPELIVLFPQQARFVHAGALDGVSDADAASLAPRPGDSVLVTRMRDGRQVTVGEQAIRARMLEAVNVLESQGAEIILLLCTGVFEDLQSKVRIIRPDRLLIHVVSAILNQGVLGVIVPLPDQIEEAEKKWRTTGLDLRIESSSPYEDGSPQWRAAARRLKLAGARLIVLDCLGFGQTARAAVRDETGLQVILPRTFMARVAAELIE